MRKEELVTDQGLSMALAELHKPERTLFYWQGTKEDKLNGKMVLNYIGDIWTWDGVQTIPAYTLNEIFELLPKKIKAKTIQEAYPIPEITADGGEEWDRQNEERDKAIDKLRDALPDFDEASYYGLSDVLMDSPEGWAHDLILNFQPGKNICYYSDNPDAEYWERTIDIDARDKHDLNPSHLAGRMLKHCFTHKLIKADNGQGILV